MQVRLTEQVISLMKAELVRGQSLAGACRHVGITMGSCAKWRGAGEALLDGRPHVSVPERPQRYAFKDDDMYNRAMARYEERCNLLIRFFLETESARGQVSGYLLDVIFRLIERGDEEGNDKVWLPIFTYLGRNYKDEWSEGIKIDKSVDIRQEVNVTSTLQEVNELFSETAQKEAVKRLGDGNLDEEDAEELRGRLRRLLGNSDGV